MGKVSTRLVPWIAALGCLAMAMPASAQKAKKKSPPPARKGTVPVKGQGQLAGVNGQFGVVYSLEMGFNFAILGARYSIEPFDCSAPVPSAPDEKLLVLDLAIKNARPEDNWFSTDALITLIDAAGQNYVRMSPLALQSKGSAAVDQTLRPGQGFGQRDLNDPLRVAMRIPDKARIVKIMVNAPRLRSADKVIRYYVAGATKAEAGEAGDPKNVIAPVAANVRDPKDPSGATALAEVPVRPGEFAYSGQFAIRADKIAIEATSPTEDRETTEGEKYVVLTFTAKAATSSDDLSMFEVCNGDAQSYELVMADGERIAPFSFRHATRDASPERNFRKGDQASYRVIFTIPSDAEPVACVFGADEGRRWTWNLKENK